MVSNGQGLLEGSALEGYFGKYSVLLFQTPGLASCLGVSANFVFCFGLRRLVSCRWQILF